MRHIVDWSTENLLIDAQGYIKLVDFGFAKVVVSKTWTLCGTPEYLAPEIIMNKGHNTGADWWALGILTYEMLVGEPPFSDDSDPMVVYQQILAAVIPEPKRGKPPLSKTARALIERLCTKEPSQRLGCMKHGVEDVRSHGFFGKINWRRLQRKLLQPPYIPELKGPLDTSNFADNLQVDTTYAGPPTDQAEMQALFKDW
jgi:serine/threonine protein kinase